MFTASSVAANTNLTTLDTVKLELNIDSTATDDDAFLTRQITAVSSKICSYLGVGYSDNGTCTLGQESLIETMRPGGYRPERIILSRWPVASIASITEAGATLDPSNYECDSANGHLFKLFGNYRTRWFASVYVINYTAGWLLPDDDGRTLPFDIEQAAIELIKVSKFARERDPSLKTESMMQREYIYEVFAPSELIDGLPVQIAALLAPYKNLAVG